MSKTSKTAAVLTAIATYAYMIGFTYGFIYNDYMRFYVDEPAYVAQTLAFRSARYQSILWPLYWPAKLGYEVYEVGKVTHHM